MKPATPPVAARRQEEAGPDTRGAAAEGEPWRWCPRCGQELENHRCKLRCPRCHYFMSCSDFDMAR